MSVTGEIKADDNAKIVLELKSIDTTNLKFESAMLIPGCPFYTEKEGEFKSLPKLSDFKYSQIVIENESNEFKVYSAGLLDDRTMLMTNCMENLDTINMILYPQQKGSIVLDGNLQEFRINPKDRKIRLHFFYKEFDSPKQGFILSSDDWISLN